MMRYQRVSPDCVSIPNPRKPSSITSTTTTTTTTTTSPLLDPKPLRVRSGSGSANPTATQTQTHDHFSHFPSTSDQPVPESNGRCSVTGDVLLQWGHNKRSRGSRAENRTVGDESSSVHSRQMIKIQRRAAAIAGAEKIAAAAAASAMPPPSRGANLRASVPHSSNRSVEERSGSQSRSEKRSPPSPPNNKVHHHSSSSSNHRLATTAANGFGPEASSSMNPESKLDQEVGGGGPTSASAEKEKEKVNLEHFEWPRIYISLSRKEKEDDFLAMKGTKLPQRPKKRAKNVDKTLQYCFPGMWLSDLTRGRYEVREKKSVKKLQKRRGLKGMESMDSDSE